MLSVNAYYGGREFVTTEEADIKPNQKVIITILDDFVKAHKKNDNAKAFEKYVGKLDDESYQEITGALKDCERVDSNEW